MEIFTVKEGKLEVIPENLNIPEFLAIWERDKTPAKLTAKSELLYIYHMVDFKSIYRDFPVDRKEDYITVDCFKNIKDWEPDDIVEIAIEKYRDIQYQSSLSLRFLDGSKSACEKLIDYFNNIDFSERDHKGNPVYKVNEVTGALEKAGKILQSIEALKGKVEKEMSLTNSKVRGGGKVNSREIPHDKK